MADPKRNRKVSTRNISQEVFNDILELQKISAQTDASRVELEKKKMEHNAQLANKTLDYQREYLNNKLPEQRKIIITYLLAGAFSLLLIFGFIVYCLHTGKEGFAQQVFLGLIALGTHFITYYFGKKVGESQSKSSEAPTPVIEDAEIVE